MRNNIKNWSWDKPTEPGDYLVCYGDVETAANVVFIRFQEFKGCLIDVDEGVDVHYYVGGYKFARLIYSPSEMVEQDDD